MILLLRKSWFPATKPRSINPLHVTVETSGWKNFCIFFFLKGNFKPEEAWTQGWHWQGLTANKTCRFSPGSLKSCTFLPPAASSMAPDGKGGNYSSIWAPAFIINSADWFLQKSFFNQEFPTPRMASTQINYLRGYLGLNCIKFQFHLSSPAILWITFHALYFCVLLIPWSFW